MSVTPTGAGGERDTALSDEEFAAAKVALDAGNWLHFNRPRVARLVAEIDRLRVEVDYYKPIAQNFMDSAGAIGRLIRAAKKVHNGPGHYPTHLGGCIGVLSEPSCECGIGDLSFAVMALGKASDSNRHCRCIDKQDRPCSNLAGADGWCDNCRDRSGPDGHQP